MAELVPSEELRAFMLRLYDAWMTQDEEALRELVSSRAHVVVIGTDPNEWWKGSDAVDIWCVQFREMPGLRLQSTRLSAYSLGNVGWAADDVQVTLQSGRSFPMRVTTVLAIERGHWRLVQWHGSLGQANETLGMTLTTGIDGIARSVAADRPDVGPASAPDGTVTIVFTDVESSSVLMERLGDLDYLRMLAWHDRIIRDVAEEHRGFVVKSQGDGFMLAFPSAAFALRSSLAMRDRVSRGFDGVPIRIRAGLHSGEAIRHDDDFYGRTVVIAARISALALGGEILASDLVHALASGVGTFTFGPARTATFKGLDGTFGVHPVLA